MTTLESLLKKITPLPWGGFKPSAQNVTRDEFLANDAYAVHAANVLPQLVVAARNHCHHVPHPDLLEALRIAEGKIPNKATTE